MKASKSANFLQKKKHDQCPLCKALFKIYGVAVVFKDVLECKRCGHIWVAMDFAEVARHM